jgi:hypothetical protein
VKARATFMTAPERYAFDLPDGFDGRPNLIAAYRFVGVTGRARAIIFAPRGRDGGDSFPEAERLGDRQAGGLTIQLYRMNATPTYVILAWQLTDGTLISSVDEAGPTGPGLDALIDGLRTNQLGQGSYAVSLTGDVQASDQREPEERDATVFYHNTTPGLTISLRKDASRTRASRGVEDYGTGQEIWVVTPSGVRVQCNGPESARDRLQSLVDHVESSLAPA